jgi:DNA-binding NarL/FixJ family response regulator
VRDRHLSNRETQIASHISAGLTSREIAAKLGIADNTVRTHRDSLYRKVGVHNAVQLANYWLRER